MFLKTLLLSGSQALAKLWPYWPWGPRGLPTTGLFLAPLLGWRTSSPSWKRLRQPAEACPGGSGQPCPCLQPGPQGSTAISADRDNYRSPSYLQSNDPGIPTGKNGEEVTERQKPRPGGASRAVFPTSGLHCLQISPKWAVR